MENINNSELPPIQTPTEPQLPPIPPQPETQITQPLNTSITPPLTQEPINQDKKKTGIRFYIISIIILLFLASVCYVLAFRSKDILNLITKKNTNSSLSQETLSNKSNLELSPLKSFISNFYNGIYKVTAQGDINLEYKINSTGYSTIFTLNNKIFYTQNGSIFRIDMGTNTKSHITNNNLFYLLDYGQKTYKQIDPVKQQNLIDLVYNQLFLLGVILKEEKNGNLLWTNIGNSEWTANWKLITETLPKPVNLKIKLNIDQNTNLINTISLKVNDSDSWQDTSYKYEPISNIDELITIPADFKDITNQ